MKRVWLILAAFLGLAAMAVPASADVVYTLNCSTVACGTTGNYGTVTLTQLGSGSGQHVQVTVLLAPNEFAGTGAGFAINWNVTGNPSLTTSLACVVNGTTCLTTTANSTVNAGTDKYDPAHFAIQDSTVGGKTYKASPFSDNWMYAIETLQNGGKDSNDNKLVFDISKSGAAFVIGDFAPINGFMFAVDIFGGPCNPTCVVAAKQIPEPQTWLLFFAGLAGLTTLALVQRRRKLARA
ncbi:MAG TPA: PEP-CTERM sorting domain-containing protein [Rhizomicrobium sp.]|nr:PEP-CTERM sorting domain-containing protein [Rhizomicrobium sp.]